jgi:symplekin
MPVGFMTLREFVIQRPSLRAEALNILLELTTHPGMALFSSAPMHVRPLTVFFAQKKSQEGQRSSP